MSARDEFYKVLGDDLTLYGNKSVLYQYLDGEQEKRASIENKKDLGKARSYQLRIRFYRRQLKAGELSPEEYWRLLLEILIQKPQFSKQCGKSEKSLESKKIIGYASEDPQPLLCEIVDIALGAEKPGQKSGVGAKLKRVYDILDSGRGEEYRNLIERMGKRGLFKPPFTKLMKLTDVVLNVAVAYDIREFFFDTAVEKQDGYSVVKRKNGDGDDRGSSRAERTDKSLRLIDYYCRKKGRTLFGFGGDEEMETAPRDMACDALYRELLAGGNEEVFVPLLVDRMTGCGIYLLGRVYFEENYEEMPGSRQRKEASCAYAVMFLDNDYGEGIETGYHINNAFDEFPDYNAARFQGDWSYEKARQEAEEIIRETNGKLPKGAPKEFHRYFEADTDTEAEELRREVERQLAECEKELKETSEKVSQAL